MEEMIDFTSSVEEFTTPNPVTAGPETSVDELRTLMDRHDIHHIPIVHRGEIVGMVSERDCRLVAGLSQKERMQVVAGDIMSVDPVTVSAGERLDEVAYEMSQNRIGSVIVNDENDQFYGVFTVTDALNAIIEMARFEEEE